MSSIRLTTVALAALMAAGIGCTREVQTRTFVVVPDSFVRPSTGQQRALAPVARGTIRLGEVDTAGSLPTPPTAMGGGPPAEGQAPMTGPAPVAAPATPTAQTSVGAMSPTTVTGADSPLDSATTAGTIGGEPGNPTMTGSATAPAGPNTHGGNTAKPGR